jgi:ferredoxin
MKRRRSMLSQFLISLLRPLGRRIVTSPRLMKHAYLIPSGFGRGPYPVPGKAWDLNLPPVPEQLRWFAGIRRDREAEERAWREEGVLRDFELAHHDAYTWAMSKLGIDAGDSKTRDWWSTLQNTARNQRAERAMRSTASVRPRRPARDADPERLTAELKAKAASLGLSAIGIAPFDRKYIFAEAQSWWFGPWVIVCVQESNWDRAQLLPIQAANETAAASADTELHMRIAKLASWIHSRGYRARANHPHGSHLVQHFAVEAGLGQMGLNGQLLTPIAGSRCRVTTIDTDAPLVPGAPRDFGIPKICDACKVCIRRCPAGAIPARRGIYRGVERVQIREDRCWPTVAQARACAICMKVCPVQRYGLQPVIDRYVETGQILGKGTDELEAYDWIDGTRYAAGVRPKLDKSFFAPPGWHFEPEKTFVPLDALPEPSETGRGVIEDEVALASRTMG